MEEDENEAYLLAERRSRQNPKGRFYVHSDNHSVWVAIFEQYKDQPYYQNGEFVNPNTD